MGNCWIQPCCPETKDSGGRRLLGSEHILLKLVIVGNAGVGKTALLFRYCDNTYSGDYLSTIGVERRVRVFGDVEGSPVKLQLWDLSGHQRFRLIISAMCRGSNAAVIAFDVSDKTSFSEVSKWADEVKGIRIVIVGTKCDTPAEKRQVSREEAEALAESIPGASYCETSALTGTNVDECFMAIVRPLVKEIQERMQGLRF